MAVLCILSHGLHNYVFGSDGKLISIQDIVDRFSDANCPALVDKPKLILMQTCQSGIQNSKPFPSNCRFGTYGVEYFNSLTINYQHTLTLMTLYI